MPVLDVFLTIMWFFLWVLWFFLLFRIIMDIFRSKDLGGWGKAGWLTCATAASSARPTSSRARTRSSGQPPDPQPERALVRHFPSQWRARPLPG